MLLELSCYTKTKYETVKHEIEMIKQNKYDGSFLKNTK